MVRKKGPDIRNGNWLFYDNSLLNREDTTPDTFTAILSLSREAIRLAAEELYMKNGGPDKPDVFYPWTFGIRLASYDETFKAGLAAEAEDPMVHNTNDNYPRELICPEIYPYLDVADDQEFAWRVPGRMSGWSATRDGLWLQIKTREHVE